MNIKTFSNAYVQESLNIKNLSRNRDNDRLSENYLEYFNSAVCRYANPKSQTFWKDMQAKLTLVSKQSTAYPKASNYRDQLEPYVLHRVNLTADHWNFVRRHVERTDLVYICLTDIRLNHVQGSTIGESPDIYIDHMHTCVSDSWLNCAMTWHNDPLAINGIFYKYTANSKTCNIGLWPVTLIPRSRKTGLIAA